MFVQVYCPLAGSEGAGEGGGCAPPIVIFVFVQFLED